LGKKEDYVFFGIFMDIGRRIVEWYSVHARVLPWREEKDAYKIWLSEIIMQQTRIAQGTAYYLRFIAQFPDVYALASAPIDEVIKLWEGLGYYSRARNLHLAAQQIVRDYGGKFPSTYLELLKLKGVGPYSARAIASFAYGENVGVVDGNVLRIMSRVLNDFSPIDEIRTRNYFQSIIDEWVKTVPSPPFNQGVMDIGSTICTPTSPSCEKCPLHDCCLAKKENTISLLPQKTKKRNRPTKYVHFYLCKNEQGEYAIQRRPDIGLWGGLYEIPNQEVSKEEFEAAANAPSTGFLGGFKHVFTHFDMQIHVFSSIETGEAHVVWASPAALKSYAFSRAVNKIFEAFIDK
jgi:A/G-specific adenine glycosylase